jgi:hypothetical protein
VIVLRSGADLDEVLPRLRDALGQTPARGLERA